MTTLMRFALIAASLIFWISPGSTQSPGASPTQAQPKAAPQIDSVVLAILIKSAIVAVQHANATGNYSVLRDLGTPIFRERYDQTKLAQIFANLRASGVNLSPALMQMPTLAKQPEITAQGQLHVVGFFPSQPLQIQYELLFLQLDGIWRIDGIAVNATPAGTAQASTAPKPDEPATTTKPKAKNSKQ